MRLLVNKHYRLVVARPGVYSPSLTLLINPEVSGVTLFKYRNFSSSGKASSLSPSAVMKNVRAQLPTLAAAGTGLVGLYGISRLMYFVTTTFMSLTPAVSLYYGFVSGGISSAVVSVAVITAANSRYISPNRVYSLAYSSAVHSEQVLELLGGNVNGGDYVTTYKSTYGYFGLGKSGPYPTWYAPKIDMVFSLFGKTGEAVVSVSATKLDETIQLIGNKAQWTMKNSLDKHTIINSKKKAAEQDI